MRTNVLDSVDALLEKGPAIVAATRDATGRPQIARCWGAECRGDRQICVSVETPAGPGAAARLRPGTEIAVTISRPKTYATVQVKGRIVAVSDTVTAAQLALVEAHLERFGAESATVGLGSRMARRAFEGAALVSVTFGVLELFRQTPGPDAGVRL